MVDVYVPNPFVLIPSALPLSSKDTSTRGGSSETTRRTIRFPVVSEINSPIIFSLRLKLGFDLDFQLAHHTLRQISTQRI
jgi:hypothetical protein